MYIAARSPYFKITESSQPPHPVILQVKTGQVQQNEQHEMKAPSGLILRTRVRAGLIFCFASANDPLLPWCSPSVPLQSIPRWLAMLLCFVMSPFGATERKGKLMMTQVIQPC